MIRDNLIDVDFEQMHRSLALRVTGPMTLNGVLHDLAKATISGNHSKYKYSGCTDFLLNFGIDNLKTTIFDDRITMESVRLGKVLLTSSVYVHFDEASKTKQVMDALCIHLWRVQCGGKHDQALPTKTPIKTNDTKNAVEEKKTESNKDYDTLVAVHRDVSKTGYLKYAKLLFSKDGYNDGLLWWAVRTCASVNPTSIIIHSEGNKELEMNLTFLSEFCKSAMSMAGRINAELHRH